MKPRMFKRGWSSAGWWVVVCLLGMIRGEAAVSFERDVAPILRTHCAGCHNDADREGEFSVETLASLRKGGDKGGTIRPGHAEDSLLIQLIEGRVRPSMPPKDEPRVPASEVAVLRKWIDEGATGSAKDESILSRIVVPEVAVPVGQARPLTAAEFSPDGTMLAVGMAGRVELRDPTGRRVRRVIDGIPGKVNAVHFSKDGHRVVVAAGVAGLNGVALVHEVGSGRRLASFGGHRDAVHDAEWSPDGQWLATAGYDRGVRLWRVSDGGLVWSNSVHNGAVFDLAFDPTGAVLASASADQTVKLWRVRDGMRLDTLNQPQGELNRVLFTPDGSQILAVGADRRIHQWRFVSREQPALNPVVASRFAHEAAIQSMGLTADGAFLITGAADRTLKAWRLPELVEAKAYEVQSDLVAAVAMSSRRARFVAARMDGSLQGYEPKFQKAGTENSKAAVAAARKSEGQVGSMASAGSLIPAVVTEERESNDTVATAQELPGRVQVRGQLGRPGDVDHFAFRAKAGEELILTVDAARSKSAMDSRLEILDGRGRPVEQVVLQAVRDSWFTFRGKDSETSDDFRLQNWAEMELDEYLYANGEVVRLWLYPRGPDSGFKVYPGEGRRQTMFGTTPISHALNEPAYIVRPIPAGSQPAPNGLPVYRIPFQNDDDPSRQAGTDSVLLFTAPATERYVVRVSDTRGFGGGTNHFYTLSIREPQPAFSVKVEGLDPKVSPGSGRELRFVATRREGFNGPIRIDIEGLPPGFVASTPVEIEAGQVRAMATLHAAPDAVAPDDALDRAVKVTASATIGGRLVTVPLGGLGNIQLDKSPKVTLEILPGPDRSVVREEAGKLLELVLRPGQTISARVRARRNDFKARIEMGNEDSGRNLPHGVYVDNIGLNGLLIVEDQTEREFFLTAAKKAPKGTRMFHLRTTADGGQCSLPVVVRVE